jgi:hypothetical protein
MKAQQGRSAIEIAMANRLFELEEPAAPRETTLVKVLPAPSGAFA